MVKRYCLHSIFMALQFTQVLPSGGAVGLDAPIITGYHNHLHKQNKQEGLSMQLCILYVC
jgi:hypothetical protein